jgi:hypothetical protein
MQSPPEAVVHAVNTKAVGSPITAMELAMMGDFPAFIRQPATRIAAASQHYLTVRDEDFAAEGRFPAFSCLPSLPQCIVQSAF